MKMDETKHTFDVKEHEHIVVEVKDPQHGHDDDGIPLERVTYINGLTGKFKLVFEEEEEETLGDLFG